MVGNLAGDDGDDDDTDEDEDEDDTDDRDEDEDADDLSVTLMEVWAGGQYAHHPFQPNLFFTTGRLFVIQQFAQLTYNYDFLTAGGQSWY